MALDLDEVFAQGGKKLVTLLQHAVRAAQTDLLFVFLVQEYRQTPTAAKAVALYRSFCSADAPARLSDSTLLPPMNPFLAATFRPLEARLQPIPGDPQSRVGQPPLLPSKLLFDSIARQIRASSPGMRALRRNYRIRKTPLQNLPGGKMTASQRFFADRIWQPVLKPRLVAAGFWRIAAID
jgi:hypothetical protein